MLQKNSFQLLPLELKLPCENPGEGNRHRRNHRSEQVEVCRVGEAATLRPKREEVECGSRKK
jgi:hypothetical protein